MIMMGSKSQIKVDMLAVVIVKPIRLRVYAKPGSSRPVEAERSTCLLIGILTRFAPKALHREMMLAVSWTTRRVSGGKYTNTPLLMTVANPQQAAASTIKTVNRKLGNCFTL
jgi:hypothetical protein